MKKLTVISFVLFSTFLYSQNYKKLFKAIEKSEYLKTDLIISELKSDKDVDTLIICLAKSIILSKDNYPHYNPELAYDYYITFHKNDLKNSTREKNKLAEQFNLNLLNIKSDIENKLYKVAKNNNTIKDYESIIKMCVDCIYLTNAKDDLENLELKNVLNLNNVKYYNDFISKYPTSINSNIIIKKRDSLEYNYSKENLEELDDFILKHPESIYYQIAKTKQDSLKNNFEAKRYQNGKLYYRGKYKVGIEIGKCYIYFENGNIQELFDYSEDGLETKYLKYFENGELRGKGSYIINKERRAEKKESGECIEYRENGKEAFKGNFTNGKVEYFYYSGGLEKVENYKNGFLEGESLIYFSNGEIKSKLFYKNGNLDGENFTYSASIKSGASYERKDYGYSQIKEVHRNGGMIERISYYGGKIIKKEYFSKDEENSNQLVSEWELVNFRLNNGQLREVFSGYDSRTGEIEMYDSGGLRIKGNNKNGTVLRYDNGLVYETKNYKNERLNGEYTLFHSGKLTKKGYFIDNVPVGEWTIYYGNGQLQFKGKSVKNGHYIDFREISDLHQEGDYSVWEPILYDGNCIYYYSNGNVLFKGNFTNGKVEYFLQDGKLFKVENYKNGKLEGETNEIFKYFKLTTNYENGIITNMELHYSKVNKNWIKNYQKLIYRKNENAKNITIKLIEDNEILLSGYLSNEGISNVIVDSLFNGKFKSFYLNGDIYSEGEIFEGMKIGLWISYDYNGEILEKNNYTENLRTSFYKNGELKSKAELKNYILNGEMTEFNKKGVIIKVNRYKNGKRHGIQKYFNENGIIESISNYRDGLEDCRLVE